MSAGVAVVTVLHDSAAYLPGFFAALGEHAPGAQVIAVDTASGDGGPDAARTAGAEVIELGANPGFGAACNAGLARVQVPVTVLLNPDTEVRAGALDGLAQRAGARDALHVPRLLNTDGTVQRSAHPLPGVPGAFVPALVPAPLLPRAVRLRAEPYRSHRTRSVGWAIAACLAARTDTLRRLGPFDPRAFLFYEDMQLCLHARAQGIATLFHPALVVTHHGGHSTRAAYEDEAFALQARRRREVVRAQRGMTAAALDEAAQLVTFAARAWKGPRERAQLRGQLTR